MKSDMRDRNDRNNDRSYRDDRGMDKEGDDRGRRGAGGFHRKKVCRFCSDSEFVLDYKDIRMMQSFVTEHGKNCASKNFWELCSSSAASHDCFKTCS